MTYAGAADRPVNRRLVSVLLPCGDRPYAALTRAIPSVLRQTHSDWELIVVSEGEHNTAMRDIASSFGDTRIRYEEVPRPDYIRTGAVRGVDALNRAQELANGDVLCVLDEETVFLPHHIRDCLDALSGDMADVVFGRAQELDLNTGTITMSDMDGVVSSSVCLTAYWGRAFKFAHQAPLGRNKWAALREAGAKLVSLSSPQVATFGDDATGRVRVSMPSLPPTESLHALVDEITASRQLSNNGPRNVELEDALGGYLGVRHVITAASGDTALGMAMLLAAERCGDRDEVILPSYTFPSTVNAVLRAGLTPVFCDVEADTLCASATTMAPLVGDRTLALFPVHAHGFPCDMEALDALAKESGTLLITDAAAAMGAQIGSQRVGAFGDIEVFSLSSTKVLTSGEGGFLSLSDSFTASRLREIARYGIDANFVCVRLGVNGRLPELSAGMALAGLPHLDAWLAARRRTATYYEQRLTGLERLRVIGHRADDRVGSAKDVACVVESPELRDNLAERLMRYRIETRPYFRPLHTMGPFKDLRRGELEVTEQLVDSMLCLPITSEIPESTTEYVCGVLSHELAQLPTTERSSRL